MRVPQKIVLFPSHATESRHVIDDALAIVHYIEFYEAQGHA